MKKVENKNKPIVEASEQSKKRSQWLKNSAGYIAL